MPTTSYARQFFVAKTFKKIFKLEKKILGTLDPWASDDGPPIPCALLGSCVVPDAIIVPLYQYYPCLSVHTLSHSFLTFP